MTYFVTKSPNNFCPGKMEYNEFASLSTRHKTKIISWNINGIRTVKNIKVLLDSLDADIICLQETKVTRDMIDEPTALVEGYNAYFSFSRGKSGYSGVATYCNERSTPVNAEEGLGGTLLAHHQQDVVGFYGDIENEFMPQELKRLDAEGRTIITQHQIWKENGTEAILTVFNVYCPRADPERADRLEFKLRFYRLLQKRVLAVRQSGSHVIVVGDVNTSHRLIDRCENVPQDEFEANLSRQWLNSFITDTASSENQDLLERDRTDCRLVDSFRFFHPNQKNAFTCWNTQINARATNYGSRIDYILVDNSLLNDMSYSSILGDVTGSDHCPVAGGFTFCILKAAKYPAACIKHFPEFFGTQQKLSQFLIKTCDKAEPRSRFKRDADSLDKYPLKKKICSRDSILVRETYEKMLNKNTNVNIVQKQISSFFHVKSKPETVQNQSLQTQLESKSETDARIETEVERIEKVTVAASAWRSMLTGPRPPPLCSGHKEPCVERRVKKKGPNFNRKFYCCARGEGSKMDIKARCDHFEWAGKK